MNYVNNGFLGTNGYKHPTDVAALGLQSVVRLSSSELADGLYKRWK